MKEKHHLRLVDYLSANKTKLNKIKQNTTVTGTVPN